MKLEIEKKGQDVHIAVIGMCNETAHFELLEKTALREAESGVRGVVFVLDRMTFITSRGLGVFVKISREIEKRSCRSALYLPQNHVHQTMEIAGFDRVISIARSEKELNDRLAG